MTEVVVIGGSGFLGRSVVSHLSGLDLAVTSVSRSVPEETLKGVSYVESPYEVGSALGAHYRSADKIIHAAWDSTPMVSAGQPSLEILANLTPLARLLEHIGPDWPGELIFLSSGGAVYGRSIAESGTVPFVEDQATHPASYYGAAKAAAEELLSAFSRQASARTTILRPSNIYGPGQRRKQGFAVVPTMLHALRAGAEFRIRGDGRARRDYLFIEDFLHFIARLIRRTGREQQHETFNVCSGQSVSIMELAEIAETVTGKRLNRAFEDAPRTDVDNVILSPVRAREQIGWQSETGLEEGLRSTWQWLTADER